MKVFESKRLKIEEEKKEVPVLMCFDRRFPVVVFSAKYFNSAHSFLFCFFCFSFCSLITLNIFKDFFMHYPVPESS